MDYSRVTEVFVMDRPDQDLDAYEAGKAKRAAE